MHCCMLANDLPNGKCPAAAEWEIHNWPFTPDDYTHACGRHVGEMLIPGVENQVVGLLNDKVLEDGLLPLQLFIRPYEPHLLTFLTPAGLAIDPTKPVPAEGMPLRRHNAALDFDWCIEVGINPALIQRIELPMVDYRSPEQLEFKIWCIHPEDRRAQGLPDMRISRVT